MNGSMCLSGFQVSRPSIERGGVALLERRVAVGDLVRDDREQQDGRDEQECSEGCATAAGEGRRRALRSQGGARRA